MALYALRRTRTVAIGGLGIYLAVSSVSVEAASLALPGTVRDVRGQALAGVEVLVVLAPDLTRLVTSAESDRDGRFMLAGLGPGSYRVAAVKTGYRTFVGRLDAWTQSTLDLVLHPAGAAEDEPGRRDATWELRLPRRSILRETRPQVAGSEHRAADRTEPGILGDLHLDVEQRFGLGAGTGVVGGPDSPQTRELTPTVTRLELASPLGERGRLKVQGRRERMASEPSSQDAARPAASHAASSMVMDLAYETAADTELAISAFYDATDYRLDPGTSTAELRHGRRAWGYDATWSQRLDLEQQVAIRLDYRDLTLGDLAPERGRDLRPRLEVANRAVEAEGRYTAVKARRHGLEFVVRARRLEPAVGGGSDRWLSDLVDGSAPTWMLTGEALDTVSVSGPLRVVFGVGVRRSLGGSPTVAVIPRLGGSLTGDGWRLNGRVSYHGKSRQIDGTGGSPNRRSPDSIGYEADLELPLTQGVHLAGGTRYEPDASELMGYVGAASEEPALYVTDGNAAVRERRVALVESRGAAGSFFEIADGQARGTLATFLPFAAAAALEPGQEVRYRSGRLGLSFPGRGTDLSLEYRRVVADAGPTPTPGTGSLRESVELQLRKSLWTLVSAGSWRLLTAVRTGHSGAGTRTLAALDTRVSAGVQVAF